MPTTESQKMGLKGMPRSHLSPPLRKLRFVEVLAQNTSSIPRLEAGGTVARCHLPAMCASITGAALQHWGHTGIASHPHPPNPSPPPALCHGALTSFTHRTSASDPSRSTETTFWKPGSPQHLLEPVAAWQRDIQLGPVPYWCWYKIIGLQEQTKSIWT